MNFKRKITGWIFAGALAGLLISCGANAPQNANYGGNRAPLQPLSFVELPLGSISPKGWLHEMLQRQADGATGHLDEIYPAVMGSRNGWLGGDGDQWERGPYWIDGLLPLAYILKDSTLITKAQPWIEWSLASQTEDGYFGPSQDYGEEPGLQRNNCRDWWPKMVMLKVMQQYYSATGDRRVIDFMTRYFHYQLAHLDEFPLDNWSFWARFRGGDNMQVAYWLYNITADEQLLELGHKLYTQTEPYTDMFLKRDKLTRVGTIHAVNLAQGLKTPIVYWQANSQSKHLQAVDCALDDLKRFHGYPNGMFSGDEAIHGSDPTQGIELCTIVEYMFSLETLYKITGDAKFAELLEKVAYNALPAQVDDQFMTRQYFQQVNQINTTAGLRNFDVNHDGLDCCFGILAGYPCCTSNMHQGWPKFTQNLWYATPDNGVAVTQYAPSEVEMLVGDGVKSRISEKTNYPFGEEILFCLEEIERPTTFSFTLRIPSWSVETEVFVNGQLVEFTSNEQSLATFLREWKAGDTLKVCFTPEVRLSLWKENSRSVERGPLVYALKLNAICKKVSGGCDPVYQGDWHYEHTTEDSWNYGLVQCPVDRIQSHYSVCVDPAKAAAVYPWSEEAAPISICTPAMRLPSWVEYKQMTGPIPYSIMYGSDATPATQIELIPYGCTTLRMTEFPMIGQHSAE